METAIRWSPHSGTQKPQFVLLDIIDSNLTLHQVLSIEDGKVEHQEVASYSKVSSFAAFDWSKTSAQIVSLGHISGNASLIKLVPGSQTSQTIATYRVKQQRRCNSTAFNIKNWLAVALDKTRSDLCLNLYDAESTSLDPIRRLCPAELVSSVRFFNQQPEELLAGAQRSFVRLYDLRDGFASGPGNLQVATRNVNNIAIDPLDENSFATSGPIDDPSVMIWDKRKMQNMAGTAESVSTFELRSGHAAGHKTSTWSLRYSGNTRGRLAVCSSAGELKIVDVVHSSAERPHHIPHNHHGGHAWQDRRHISTVYNLEYPTSNRKRGRAEKQRLVAFDWMTGEQNVGAQSVFALYADRNIRMLEMRSHRVASISSRHELGVASKMLTTVRPAEFDMQQSYSSISTFQPPKVASIPETLGAGMLQQTRCKAGYLFDCQKNIAIVSGSLQLERFWETIQQLRDLADRDGMTYDSADLSYVGISGLWSESVGSNPQRRLSPSPVKPLEAIVGINEKRGIPPFEGERTDYPEHRQLCLAICGWRFTTEALEAECRELIQRGLYYRAIVQAVLHGAKQLSLELLLSLIRDKTVQNNGLATLLAADELNKEQRDMTNWMAAETDDPALKALLTYLSTGDWRDVMKTSYLSLAYRLALGLKYLNDTELDGFIQTELARAIKNGDLEGILLTGLAEQSMDLLQAYIQRTNDLQTAVLASAFTNPLYVEDARWQMWKETYFMQMQAWQAFTERTRFVIAHNKLARTREGRCLVEVLSSQIKVYCVHCRSDINAPIKTRPVGSGASAGVLCTKCGRHLPRCSICTLWLQAPNPRARPLRSQKDDKAFQVLEKLSIFCTRCSHGAHAHHAQEWFARFNVCASPGCDCACKDNGTISATMSSLFTGR